MATMNISVPDPMKDWVQSQVNTGTYANTSDYVRDLIRQDQHQHSKLEMLQAAITAGIESGVSDKSFDQIIEQVRHELKKPQRMSLYVFSTEAENDLMEIYRYGFLNYAKKKLICI